MISVKALATAALAAAALPSVIHACTVIAVGRNASVDGSTLMAHTDDAGGGAADLRLVNVPALDHANGSMRAVYHFKGGYPRLVSNERGPGYAPKDDSEKVYEPLGYIPQVPHTYAYLDQDYGMINEVQLSIAESTCGARTVGWSKDLPYGHSMFGIAELSKVALERCDSARCAIQTMGDLAVEYGFYSEDSGDPADPGYIDSAEALAIADKYGEAWMFHVLTGEGNASAVWAAQRVPDDHVSSMANSFVIREMQLNDSENFMYSPNLVSFAEKMGWYSADMGAFDFSATYGFRDFNPIRPLYTGRRVWRVFDLLAPSLQLDSRLGLFSQYPTYPFSVKPDELVSLDKVMTILRDYYVGTPYDMTKGDSAGPFGSPVRWDGDGKGVVGGWERPISMFRTVYSFVLQARGHLSDAVGGVAWYSHGTPHASVYVPFACQQTEVPESYLKGKQSEFSLESAWWAFDFLNNWSLLRFDSMSVDIRAKVAEVQNASFAVREAMELYVSDLTNTTDIAAYLQTQSNAFATSVVTQWWQFAWATVAKFTNGYITTGEEESEMASPGYPAWYLASTDFAQWPGDSIVAQGSMEQEIEAFHPPVEVAAQVATVTSPETTAAQPSDTHASVLQSVLQIGGGAFVGFFVGAGVVLFAGRRRRSGYETLA